MSREEKIEQIAQMCDQAIEAWRRGDYRACELICLRIEAETRKHRWLEDEVLWSDGSDLRRRIIRAAMEGRSWEKKEVRK